MAWLICGLRGIDRFMDCCEICDLRCAAIWRLDLTSPRFEILSISTKLSLIASNQLIITFPDCCSCRSLITSIQLVHFAEKISNRWCFDWPSVGVHQILNDSCLFYSRKQFCIRCHICGQTATRLIRWSHHWMLWKFEEDYIRMRNALF